MSNKPHDRPNGNGAPAPNAFEEAQQVIQPSPTPATWLASIAQFPDPIKGTMTRLVVVDIYDQTGLKRVFLEPGAALAVGERITEAAKLATNRGVQVIEGAQAHEIARAARHG